MVFVELAVEPVITGISCPTRIDASSLSKVSRLGVERIFDSESLANAETRVAKLKPSPKKTPVDSAFEGEMIKQAA